MDDHSTKTDLQNLGQQLNQTTEEVKRELINLSSQLEARLGKLDSTLKDIQDKLNRLESKINK